MNGVCFFIIIIKKITGKTPVKNFKRESGENHSLNVRTFTQFSLTAFLTVILVH